MAITYTEKGHGLHDAIRAAGFSLRREGDLWVSSDDVAVQAIIDSYSQLANEKKLKIEELKVEAVSRASAKYSNINSFDDMLMMRDLILSVVPAARSLRPNIQYIADIYQAGIDARVDINALTDLVAIRAYDVVNTPTWPV